MHAHSRFHHASSDSGFSLIEVVVAFFVMSLLVGVGTTMLVSSIKNGSETTVRLRQAKVAEAVWERIQGDGSWLAANGCAASECTIDPAFYEAVREQAASGSKLTVTATSRPVSAGGTTASYQVAVVVRAASGSGIGELAVGGLFDPSKVDSGSGNDSVAAAREEHERTTLSIAFHPSSLAQRTEAINAASAATGADAQVVQDIPAIHSTVVRIKDGTSDAMRDHLNDNDLVDIAEPDALAAIAATPASAPAVDDPRYPAQWAHRVAGVETAWRRSNPDAPRAFVVTLDSGVDGRHDDLRGSISPGLDLLNDDNNPDDANGHGTAVAGIIVARANNGRGIAGVAPRSDLAAIKVCDADAACSIGAVAYGLTLASDQGANVVNISITGPGKSRAAKRALAYAAKKGVVVTCAAGNEGTSVPQYPAAYPDCISVASTNHADEKSVWSSFGDTVDLAAPGENILVAKRGGGYRYDDGTSFAAPYVAGIAALLVEEGLNREQIHAVLFDTARDIGAPGDDIIFGNGRVDAAAALSEADKRTTVGLGRMYRHSTTGHYYPTSRAQRDNAANLGYNWEGVEGHLHNRKAIGTVALREYYKSSNRSHYYSTSTRSPAANYAFRGVSGYVYPRQVAGTVPLYYTRNGTSEDHFYTSNWDYVLGANPLGFRYQRVVGYVFPAPS